VELAVSLKDVVEFKFDIEVVASIISFTKKNEVRDLVN
jgi:hypothetical protein